MMLGVATAKVSLDASDFISNAAKVASASGQMEQAVSKSGGSLGDKILANAGNLTKFGLIMGGIGAGITGAFALGEKTAIGFGREMANVNSIAQLSQKQLDAVGRSVQDIAIATGKGPTDLAAGLYDVYSVGFEGADAMKILEISAKGANAGLTDTSTSARVLTGTLNAFGVSGDQAQHYMDVLFQTVNDGAVSFEELSHNLANTAPMASTLGVSIEELGAGYALMTKNGIPAAQTETQIAALMRAGVNPTGDMTKALNDYGYTSVSSLIKAKGFGGYLEFLNQASGGTAEGMSKLLGSSEAVNAALVLGKNGLKGYNEELTSMKGASEGAGATQRALDKQMESTSFKLQRLSAAFDVLKIRMVSGFTAPLNFGIDAITKLIQVLANLPPGVQKVIATIAGLTGVLLTVGGASILAAVKIAEFGKLIKDLTNAETAMQGVGKLMSAPFTKLGSALRLISVEEGAIAAGPLLPWVAAAAVAAGAFYLAYKTNFLGIGDITRKVAGTAKKFWDGFSAGFSDAHKNMNFVSAGLMGLSRGIVTAFGGKDHMVTGFLGDMVNWLFNAASSVQKFGNYLKHAFDFGTQFKQLDQFGFIGRAFAASIGIPIAALGKLVQAYRQGGFIGMAKELPNFVGHMGDAFQALDVGISRSIEALGRKFPGLAKVTTPLAHAFDEAGKAGNAFIHSIGDIMRGDFKGALKDATKGVKLLGKEALDLGQAAGYGIEKLGGALKDGIGGAFKNLTQQFPAFSGLWSRLNGIFGNAAGLIGHLGGALGDLFKGDFGGMFKNLGSAAMDGLKILGNAMGTVPSLIAGVFKSINWGDVGSALSKGLDAATGLAFQGLSAAGGAFSKVWDGLKNGLQNLDWSSVGSLLSSGFQSLGGMVSGAWDWLTSSLGSINWGGIADTITGGLAGALSNINWSGLASNVGNIASSIISGLGDFAGEAAGWVMKGVAAVANGLRDLATAAAGNAPEIVSAVVAKLGDWASAAANWIFKGIGAITSGLRDLATAAIGSAPELVTQIVSKLGDWAGAAADWIFKGIGAVTSGLRDLATAAIGAAPELVTQIVTKLGDWGSAAADWIFKGIGAVTSGLRDLATAALGAVPQLASQIITKLGDWTEAAAAWVLKGVAAITSNLGQLGAIIANAVPANIGSFITNKLGSWAEAAATWALSGVNALTSNLGKLGDIIAAAVPANVGSLITTKLGEWAGAAGTWVQNGIDAITGAFKGIKETITGAIPQIDASAITDKLKGVTDGLTSIGGWVSTAVGNISGPLKTIKDTITGAIPKIDASVITGPLSGLKSGLDTVAGWVSGAVSTIKNGLGDVGDFVSSPFGGGSGPSKDNKAPTAANQAQMDAFAKAIQADAQAIQLSAIGIEASLTTITNTFTTFQTSMADFGTAAATNFNTNLYNGLTQVGNTINALTSGVGGGMSTFVTAMGQYATDAGTLFNTNLYAGLTQVGNTLGALVSGAAGALSGFVVQLAGFGTAAGAGFNTTLYAALTPVGDTFNAMIAGVSGLLSGWVVQLAGFGTAGGSGFNTTLYAALTPVGSTVGAMIEGVAGLLGPWAGQMGGFGTAGGSAFSSNLQPGLDTAVSAASNAASAITASGQLTVYGLRSAGSEAGNSYARGIQSGMDQAVSAAQQGASAVASALGAQDLSSAGYATGASFSSGVAAGILSNLGAIQSAASQVVSAAAAAAAATAMIHSPSRLFARDIGEPITLGTAMGMTSKRSMLAIQSAGRSVINATRGIMAPVVSPRMAVAGRASGGSVVVNNNQQLHIQQNPGEDMNAFATRVIDILTESGRSIA